MSFPNRRTDGPGLRHSEAAKGAERSPIGFVRSYRPDGANGLDALLVGYYKGKKLRFAGKVRAGLVPHVRREVLGKLKPLQVQDCPFANLPDTDIGRWGAGITADQMRVRGTPECRVRRSTRWSGGVTAEEMSSLVWVKPTSVVQVRFQEWTSEGRLRHPSFLGLRIDKDAKEVHRDG